MKQAVLEEAARTARGLRRPLIKARALMDIALQMQAESMRAFIEEAARIPGGILAAGGLTDDRVERVELLGALCMHLECVERDEVVHNARSIVEQIHWPYDRARAFIVLIPFVDPIFQGRIVEDVVAIARQLDRKAEIAEILTAIAPFVGGDQRKNVLREAAAAARDIVPGDIEVTYGVDPETCVVESARWPANLGRPAEALLAVATQTHGAERARLLSEALESIYEHPQWLQADALLRLGPHMSDTQVWNIVADYRSVVQNPLRHEFLKCVTGWLGTEDKSPDIWTDIENDATREDHARASQTGRGDQGISLEAGYKEAGIFSIELDPWNLSRLSRTPAITITRHSPGFQQPDDEMVQVHRSIVRAHAAQCLPDMPTNDLEAIRENARDLVWGRSWRCALATLLHRLATLQSVAVALDEARAIWRHCLPPEVIGALAPQLSPPNKTVLLKEALATARQLKEDAQKAAAFGSILPYMEEPDRGDGLLDLAATLERMVGDPLDRRELAGLVPKLAALLPRARLLSLIESILRSEPERLQLLQQIRKLAPVIVNLGGPGVALPMANTVLELSRWDWSETTISRLLRKSQEEA
jgi:hypothetical protein